MTKIYSIFFLILVSFVSNPTLAAFDHKHAQWNKTLKEFVTYKDLASTVDYAKLKKGSKSLNAYLKELQMLSKKEFNSFTEKQKLAMWINAYNAFTLKIVADHYPVKSIKDIGSLLKSTWKIKFIHMLGKKISLDHIEHKIIRKEFNEPRIHFAVNCASIGCPRLRNEAFTAEKLEAQLEEQTKDFLTDTSRNKVFPEKKMVRISKIFDWFDEDFEKGDSSVQKFIAAYITKDEKIRAALMANKFKVKYFDYDWGLNKTHLAKAKTVASH